ncbi:MAG TPA: hypothetical protein PKK06_15505 [Phycisphaerae bacterium]|nr:hypothetical protein [Phycisphaerae bacterium]HNU45943.1 hypothetical protein [Phycisphaerae bacterium]
MSCQGTVPEVFLQAEAAIAELEQEVQAYKHWADEWVAQVQTRDPPPTGTGEGTADASSSWPPAYAGALGAAAFWTQFAATTDAAPDPTATTAGTTEASADTATAACVDADLRVAETTPGLPPDTEPAGPTEDFADVQSAMRSALAAAYAELETDDAEPPRGAGAPPVPAHVAAPVGGGSTDYTDDLIAKPLPAEPACPPVEAETETPPPGDLDPVVAQKLRMLRRLNPNKSQQELLAQIAAEGHAPGQATPNRKRWFGRK